MRLQTTKSKLNESDIVAAIEKHPPEYLRKQQLKSYYAGRHRIAAKQGRANTDINNKVVNNFAAYITNLHVGFFLGKPVSYKVVTSLEADFEKLLNVFKYNDESAHNLELAEEASICGVAYELLYIDGDAQLRLATLPSEEMIMIVDTTPEANVVAAIRHYRIYELGGYNYTEFADVYDAERVNRYELSGGQLILRESTAHYFNDVPVIEYPNNSTRRGDFEDVLSLIDAYNLAQSLTLDDLSDFTDAFLVLKNLHVTDDESARDLRRRKIIETDADGGAQWLIKNLNDTYIENLKNRLQRDIHKFSCTMDITDSQFFNNLSGVALKFRLIGMSQVRSRKEREFKKALQRRIELLNEILKLKNLPAVDFREVGIIFTENVPADTASLAQMITQLDGLVSRKTLLSLLPFVEDAVEELKELEAEAGGDLYEK